LYFLSETAGYEITDCANNWKACRVFFCLTSIPSISHHLIFSGFLDLISFSDFLDLINFSWPHIFLSRSFTFYFTETCSG
jgi:hypothetical protein